MKLTHLVPGSRSARLGAALGVSTATLLSSAAIGPLATTAHAASSPIDVILAVGANQAQRVVSWYTQSSTQQEIVFEEGTTLDRKAATLYTTPVANIAPDVTSTPLDPTTGAALSPAPVRQSGFYNAHVTLTGLKANRSYTYKVGDPTSGFSKTYTFTTGKNSNAWTFDFFGDPQLGSSRYTPSDGAGWAATLNYAASHDHPGLLVSGGDQVDAANDEYQWSSFIGGDQQDPKYQTDVLKEIPWAETIGNHEASGYSYQQHFFPPNLATDSAFYTGSPTSVSGGDYWFIYKNVLFIDINSTAYSGGSDDAHVGFVTKVIHEVGNKVRWKVLVYHHSIYSPADHANDPDNQARRPVFTKAFSALGVNLVLQGHDHSYSRSYAIKNTGSGAVKAHPNEQPGARNIFPGPGGVVYVTADSASGSKYYDLTTPTGAAGYGADTQFPSTNNVGLPRHWANSVEDQENVQTYVKVEVDNGKLQVSDVRVNDNLGPNSAVDFSNNNNYTKWTGVPTNLSTPAAPGTGLWPNNPNQQIPAPNPLGGVGTLVDSFTLHLQNAKKSH